MPFFRSINLERMLICQKHLFMKKYQLSCHLMCKLVKKSCMLSNVRIATYKRFSTEKINGKKVFQSHRLPIITELSPKLCWNYPWSCPQNCLCRKIKCSCHEKLCSLEIFIWDFSTIQITVKDKTTRQQNWLVYSEVPNM